MKSTQGNEWHPWLKMFTILAIPAGLLLAPMGFFGLGGDSNNSIVVFLGVVMGLVIPIGIIGAAVHTLRVSDYFRRWSEVTGKDRLFAYLAIYMGLNMFIALLVVAPFMRFITDAVGGGLGVSNRS